MLPNDSGPIYRETLMGRLPVEPWNTWSNLIFLFVVLYWAARVYRAPRDHRFLAAALPILFVGFVGGTLFHGTRSHELWLLLDWVPILLLCIACTALFARRAGLSVWLLGPLLVLPFVLRYLIIHVWQLPRSWAMNVGYAALGITVLLPIALHLHRTRWRHWPWMAASATCFALAVTFRSLDHSPLVAAFPMGTHWLWHSFGGIAVFWLVGYIWHSASGQATPTSGH